MAELTREDIKQIFNEAVAPIVVEMKSFYEAHEKDLERLSKQSAEHYSNFKSLEDKIQGQIMQCTAGNSHTAEKAGKRIGDIERDITRIDSEMSNMRDDIVQISQNRQFTITQVITVVGILVMVALGIMPYIKG